MFKADHSAEPGVAVGVVAAGGDNLDHACAAASEHQVGQPCAVLRSPAVNEECKVSRGLIVNIAGLQRADQVEVRLVDIGITVTCMVDELRLLPTDLMGRAVTCLPVKLSGVINVQDSAAVRRLMDGRELIGHFETCGSSYGDPFEVQSMNRKICYTRLYVLCILKSPKMLLHHSVFNFLFSLDSELLLCPSLHR